MGRFECHAHTQYSNLRILDSINRPRDLINYAQEIGLAGIAITDHECLSSFVELDKIQNELIEAGSSFKIARGDEIYLVDSREKNQQYWHFILIAKNAIGCKMLRELSSIAWINSYFDRGLERVPILKSELKEIIQKYGKGNLIASSGCLGSELDHLILEMNAAEERGDKVARKQCYHGIIDFINFCDDLFGDDFYLEVQPAQSKDQLIVNKKMGQIAKAVGRKVIVTTDAHYLKKEDREIHKAFLNSKQGDREVDEFYEYAYLQTTEEVIQNLEGTGLDYSELEKNTLEIYDKLEYYTIQRKQHVPEVEVPFYPKEEANHHSYDVNKYPTLDSLMHSDNLQERYWINYCREQLDLKNLNNEVYLSRLEEEADTKKVIGEKLETCMFAYPIFLQHYIDLFWECGSCTGAGRGCFLPGKNNVLLANGQVKKIEDVKIGDYVKTIDGSSQKVIDTLSYDCAEEVYKITPYGMTGQPLFNTDNHEYWAMKNTPCPCDRKYCSMNCLKRNNCRYKKIFKKEWVRADELNVGDYIYYPRPKFEHKKCYRFDLAQYCPNNNYYVIKEDVIISKYGKGTSIPRYINIDKKFLYFVGVMIGDGWTCLNNGGKVGIAFNSDASKDIESMNKCIQFLNELNINTTICKHRTKNLNQVYGYCYPFAALMQTLIGKGVENKKIDSRLLYDNREEMLELLKGLLASDGSYESEQLRFSYDSINYNLICQVKMLCAYLGLYSSIVTRKPHGNCKQSYKLRVGGPQLNDFVDIFPLLYQKKSKNKTQHGVMVDKEGFWFKVEKIEHFFYDGKVYDLTVENNHNYIVNNVVVHNSAGAGLNHYLLGITQTDPIKTNAPWFRYMNKDRVEIGDKQYHCLPFK